MRLKYILSVLFLLFLAQDVFAQLGSTHYFPPMHTKQVINVQAHRMYFSTPFGDNILPANRIRVELTDGTGNPVMDNAGVPIAPFFIWNGQSEFRDIRYAGTGGATDLLVLESELNIPLRDRGIVVSATAEIYVSARLEAGNHAGYLTGKGSNALGQDFRIGHMPMVQAAGSRNFFVGVMALEANTLVTFSEYDNAVVFNGIGLQPGSFSRTLQEGESLVISGYTQDPDNGSTITANFKGFIGARVTSNKDIIVNTGNLLGNTIAAFGNDMGIDQIVPVDLVGTEYLMVPGAGIGGATLGLEVPLVIATVANTTISVNGGIPIATLANPGDFFEIPAINYIGTDHEHMYIETSEPTYVYQVIAGSNSNSATPGMNFIPPLSCFFQQDVNLIPDVDEVADLGGSSYTGSIIVLAEPGQPVRINGVLTTAIAEPALGTSNWVSYKIPIPGGGNVAIDSDGPIAAGLIGTSNNAGIAGYYSGFAVIPQNTTTDICTLDGPVNLVDRIDGNPAGTGTFTPALAGGGNIFDPLIDAPGLYVYNEIGVCENVNVDIIVNLVDNPVINPIADIERCQGDSYTLPDPATIAGTNLNDPQYYTDEQSSGLATLIDWTIPYTTVSSQLIYVFDENPADPDACEAELFFNLTINATPVATVTDAMVCEDTLTFPITLTQTAGGSLENYQIDYDAAANAAGFTDVAAFVPLPGANLDIPMGVAPGVYTGVLTYQDVLAPGLSCTGTDTFTITINANPVATTNDAQVCQGITTEPIVVTATTGAPTGYYIDYDPAAEAVGFTDAGTAMAPLTITGANYAIPAAGTPGVYNGIITYLDANGCSGTDPFTIEIFENPVATTNDLQVCQGVTTENIVITATTGVPVNYFIDYDPAAEAVGFTDVADITTPATITGATYAIPAAGTPGVYNGSLTYIDANGCSGTDPFTIEIFANPVATTNDVAVCEGVTSELITLTTTTGTPINYFIDYDVAAEAQGFVDVADSMTAVPIAGAAYTIPAAAMPGIYNGTLSYLDANGCMGTDPFTITVNVNPIATTNDAQVCQGTIAEPIVVTATTGTPIAYYIDYDAAAEADGFIDAGTAMAPLAIAAANYAIPATGTPGVYNGIITYLDANGCSGTDPFTIEIFENPVATVNDANVCEGDTTEIITVTATTGTPINYHIDYDAVAEGQGFTDVGTLMTPLPIAGASYFIPAAAVPAVYNGIITYFDANGCSGTDAFTITVHVQPTATMPLNNLEECDTAVDGDDTNGFLAFTLTDQSADILNGQDPTLFSISFHESNAAALAGTPEVGPVFTNTIMNQQTIHARVENNANPDCFAITTFEIIVHPKPVVIDVTLEQCDDDTDGFSDFNLQEANVLISVDALNETFTYYETMGEATSGMGAIMNDTSYPNAVVTNDVVWARIETMNGCIRTARVDLLVTTSQIPPTFLLEYEVCDNDLVDGDSTNGIASFNFSNATPQIVSLFPPTDQPNLVVTYYTNASDAAAESNPIPDISDHRNDTSPNQQLIYVRVDNVLNNSCSGLGHHITLNVIPAPPANTNVLDYELCDEGNDLTEDFILPTLYTEILNGLNPADYDITFYDDPVNADMEIGAIPDTYPFTPASTPSSLTLYARVTNIVTPDRCYTVIDFDIVLFTDPVANPMVSTLFVCDDAVPDGFTSIDLSVKDNEIKGTNNTGVTVTYHIDQAGADAADMSIPDKTDFTNTMNPQTVVARLTDDTTGCYDTTLLTIEVLQAPAVVSPPPYEKCDEDNDGFAVFELGTLNDDIFAGDPTLTIEYYYTQSDAETAPDDISLRLDQVAFTNILPYNDSVWARVENSGDCETIIEVFLVVLNSPTPNTNPDPYVLCDTNNDGVEIFDLTSRETEILDGLDPTIYDIVWYSDPLIAGDDSPLEPASDIADEVNYVSGTTLPLPGYDTVYARVINTTQSPTTRCFEVVTLELEVQPIPTPDQPEAYELCDDLASGSTTDEISIFDLRSRDVIITGGTATWNVTYYFSEVEAEVGDPTTWLADMYPNAVPASQTIWARVQDTNTGCFATVSQTLVVNPNPSPTSIPPVEVCDLNPDLGDTTADNSGLFDLADIALMIENGETNVATIFYQTLANANDEMSPITTDPYQSISGSIWGRVQNTNTGCFTVVEVELLVNPSPVISDPLPELTACDEDPNDGEAVFDLTLNETAIYGSQTPADYNLTYHTTQASAEAAVGSALDTPIAMATLMNYTSTSATIWVRLENIITGCTNTGSFAITVAPTPAFMDPPATFFACDTTDSGSDTDGITSFDLTEITDIISSSNPDLIVTYYVNAADIPASPIPTPMSYQGTGADPQTIFMVIESTTAGMCSVQEVIDLRVNTLPVLISDPLPNAVGCDPDNDGFTLFNLIEYSDLILDGQTGISLSFFEVEQDAIDNTTANAIDISVDYNNISGMTTLYVRAESVDNMPENSLACAKVFAFELEAHPTPILPAASIDLSITDCDLDGDDGEFIDLTVNEGVILAAQDPAFSYIITYHESPGSAADLSDMGIADPTNHLVTVLASPATIYYRILFDDGSECMTIGNFEVTVGALPAIMDPTAPLEVCDDDTDEIALFDLTSIIDDLTFSNPLLQVDFYESQAVIDAGGFAIPEDQLENYSNVSNPQLMQIIVTSLEGCTVQTQLTLRVLPLPSPDNSNPDPIIVCDDDFDGFYTFDGSSVENLLDKADEIDASNATNVEMFESLADAEAYDKVTMLPTPIDQSSYTNSVPNGQTIYARVDHNDAVPGNDCYVIVTFDLIINPLPVINPDITDPYVFCEQEDGDDSVGILNLDIIASEIGLLAPPQQEADFNITYHLAQSQAENDAFALTSPYEYNEAPAPNNGLWIRVENKVSGCYVLVFEEIIVEARPLATTPEPMMACEVIEPDPALPNGIPLAGVGEFDLTSQDEIINDGPLDADTQVNYFITEADALSNSNAITDPDIFFNTSNPQTIWAVTQNTLTTCASSPPVFFEISVKATPYTDLSQEGGDICVDPSSAEVLDPITLDATPETVVSGASYSYLWYLNGALFSQDPVIQVTQTGDYTVAVTATYTDITTGMITSCAYLAGANYTPISAPLFEVEVLEDSFNSNGLYTVQVIDSSISGFGAADYEFAIDDGPFQSGLTFTNVSPGDHIVYGRRVDGNCEATPVEVGIIDYPRFFTPNQDGFHDTWNIYGLGSAPNLNAKIFIFDRYGKLLKQLSPTSPGWNGTYNGQAVPSTDYWFRVEFTEPDGVNEGSQRTFTGHFALKR